MIKTIFIAFMLLPSLAYGADKAWLGPERASWPDTEFRKVKNDFAGVLLVTPDVDWQAKWNTPPDTVPYFSEAKTVKVGEEIVILTFFANPKIDNDGNVSVLSSIKVTRPDGSISVDQHGIQCVKGKLEGSPDNIRLSPAVIHFFGEKSDPLGKWEVEVEIHDINRNTKLELKTSFELING